MPDLRKYREKRDPGGTPEPFGGDVGESEEPRRSSRPLPAAAARSFVVQQHDATRMHWDLRLEIDGVLVSWAIPRGPSLDPQERRLAVQTEDHPMEYANFEGVIPEGNYGAGAMIVWDRGSYHTADGLSPAESLAKGKLDLVMDGHKLRGRFALVKTRGADGVDGAKSWLLLHKDRSIRPDDVRPPELVETQPASVFSGLRVEELREARALDDEIAKRATAMGARSAKDPLLDVKKLRPMLAGTADEAFSKPGWLFEIKYDGMRVLAARSGKDVRLFTRSGRNVSVSYPEITRSLALLPLDEFILDGEIVALDERGHSSFERLQKRFSQVEPVAVARAQIEVPTVLYAFDLLSAGKLDVRALPLEGRKKLLDAFVPALGQVRFTDHVEEHGTALFEAAVEHDLEGVIAKRGDSRYETGRRSKNWLKVRVPHSAMLAIVGWDEGKGSRLRLGSLKLAWHQNGELVFAGNVGSGLDDATIATLLPQLEASELDEPAFGRAPASKPKGTHYVRPSLVAEVRYTEVTSQGNLRHPVLLDLHDGIELSECTAPIDREMAVAAAPAPVDPQEVEIKISRREKVFWPEDGTTKGDLLDYYDAIWPFIAPYLRDRPVVLTRYPDGIDGKSFFQQNAPDWTPDWARRETIDGTDFFICNEKRTLLHVINSGAIPLHVWHSRRTNIDRPDWITLDLDPKSAPFADVVTVARHIHKLLDSLGAPNVVKTSGQAGLHVLVPIGGLLDHDDARSLAEVLARVVVGDLPEIAAITRPIAARGDKVYVDFGQNGRGRLIASPFSVRPKLGAPVSTPLTWGQVTSRLDPAKWNMRTTPRRMKQNGDPLRALMEERADVGVLLDALAQRLS